MSLVSYAQNFEDVMLRRALGHVEIGFYIDVGANDPVVDSVTKAFYDRGWRGINIEPVPQWHQRLQEHRPRDINLRIAAGASHGETTLYELPDTGLSTMDRAIALRHCSERGYALQEIRIATATLDSVCAQYHVAPIHFIKIDVEGAEKAVLQGLDLAAIRPWIILIEATLPNTRIDAHQDWEPLVTASGYDFVYFDGLNRFYVAREHAELKKHFLVPPNVFDEFKPVAQYWLEEKLQQQHEQQRLQAEAFEQQNRWQETLQNQIQELREALEQAHGQAQSWQERAAGLDGQLQQTRQELQQTASAAQQRQEQAGRELQQAIDSVRQQQALTSREHQQAADAARHWQIQAAAWQAERDALLQSWSWRITAPLRLASGLLAHPVLLLMRWALRNPALGHSLNRQLQRWPFLHGKLAAMARRNGLMASHVPTAAPADNAAPPGVHPQGDPHLASLTPTARRIYQQLQQATRAAEHAAAEPASPSQQ